MVSKSLTELDQAAQVAAAKAQAAEAAAAEAHAEAARQRQARLDAWDREQRGKHDPAAYAQELDNARRDLREALAADPVWSCLVRVGVAERHLHRPTSPVAFDQLANLADSVAHDIVQAEQDALYAARQAAGGAT